MDAFAKVQPKPPVKLTGTAQTMGRLELQKQAAARGLSKGPAAPQAAGAKAGAQKSTVVAWDCTNPDTGQTVSGLLQGPGQGYENQGWSCAWSSIAEEDM